jgi:glycosyltransferase involved in cell wall biosynthesis
MKGKGLSVAIIARDEADRIAEAIRSVRFADEIVVLDSGSKDDTVSISRSLGARVVETDWPGYVAQKNRALEHVTHDWVLSIDADERVSPELAVAIQRALADDPSVAGFRVARRQRYLGRWIRFCGWYPDLRIRLFRRNRCRWVGTDPHDRIEADGPVHRLKGDLLHEPFRDLADHLAKINRYSAIFAREAQAQGRRARWWDLTFRPPLFFLKRYLLNLGFLDGIQGMVVCAMGAFYILCRWAKLYELQKGLARSS